MPIVPQGTFNAAGLVVPDLYVAPSKPRNIVLNGVPTNVAGVVGSASWGPVGSPVIVGSYPDYVRAFGSLQARAHDMGTLVAVAVQQGANDFRCVRVADGTEEAAVLETAGADYAARHTGTVGNTISLRFSVGSRVATKRVVVGAPGMSAEVFDNLPSATPAAFWPALAAALNNGVGVLRGASALVTATVVSAAEAVPADGTTLTLAGGLDGATGVDDADLVGTAVDRTGMHALAGQGCDSVALADGDDSTHWSELDAFAQAEGFYAIVCGPAGDTIAEAVTRKRNAGIDSTSLKLMHGDWLYWNDATSRSVRLVSPQGFVLGRLVNLSPEQSSLNKELFGVVGSQKGGVPGASTVLTYSNAELQALFVAGIDVVTNPIPRGAKWGVRAGHNSSSEAGLQGDNHPRMTNFLARTIDAGAGVYVGEPITTDLLRRIRATLSSFLQNLKDKAIIEDFSVVCDEGNNPSSQTELNFTTADVTVRYLGINEKFIVNLEAGQTARVERVERSLAA